MTPPTGLSDRPLPTVLHVIGPMTIGGAQTQLLGLVKAAHGVRWNATVCATSPGPLVDEFRAAGVELLELNRWASPGLLRAWRLRRIAKRRRFDVINGHLWQGNAFARIASLYPRRPVVVIVEHNVEVRRSVARRVTDRLLARRTDAWIAVTEAMHDFTAAMHPIHGRRIERIPYGLDKSIFFPVSGAETRGVRLRIGSVGRLFPEKGFAVLIEAVRILVEKGRKVEVEIAGVGPLREELQSQAIGLPVTFVGAIEPGEPVAAFLRSLDVFVLPSTHREARPVVVLEAQCCGIAVVATDIPGMIETTGGGAVIVAPSDPAALADGLSAALDDDEAAARSLAAAQQIPSFDEVAARYAELFSTLITAGRVEG